MKHIRSERHSHNVIMLRAEVGGSVSEDAGGTGLSMANRQVQPNHIIAAVVRKALLSGDNGMSLRDIVVGDTTESDWKNALHAVCGAFATVVELEGVKQSAPYEWDQLLRRLESTELERPTIKVSVGEGTANAFFFCFEEIEFDVSIRELHSDESMVELHRFIRTVAHAVGRPVYLCSEGSQHDEVFGIYDPADDNFMVIADL